MGLNKLGHVSLRTPAPFVTLQSKHNLYFVLTNNLLKSALYKGTIIKQKISSHDV